MQNGDGLFKGLGLEIQKQWNGKALEVVNSLRRLNRRTAQDASAPGLPPQAFGEDRSKFIQAIGVVRLADKGEGQLAGLGKVFIVNLESLDRFEFSRKQIQDLGIEGEAGDQNIEAEPGDKGNRKPDETTTLRDEVGDKLRV